MRPSVLPGPIMPQSTMPMTMRSDGAGRPAWPSALAGMNVGAAMAEAAVAIKRRREILDNVGFIMGGIMPNGLFTREQKNAAAEPRWDRETGAVGEIGGPRLGEAWRSGRSDVSHF